MGFSAGRQSALRSWAGQGGGGGEAGRALTELQYLDVAPAGEVAVGEHHQLVRRQVDLLEAAERAHVLGQLAQLVVEQVEHLERGQVGAVDGLANLLDIVLVDQQLFERGASRQLLAQRGNRVVARIQHLDAHMAVDALEAGQLVHLGIQLGHVRRQRRQGGQVLLGAIELNMVVHRCAAFGGARGSAAHVPSETDDARARPSLGS